MVLHDFLCSSRILTKFQTKFVPVLIYWFIGIRSRRSNIGSTTSFAKNYGLHNFLLWCCHHADFTLTLIGSIRGVIALASWHLRFIAPVALNLFDELPFSLSTRFFSMTASVHSKISTNSKPCCYFAYAVEFPSRNSSSCYLSSVHVLVSFSWRKINPFGIYGLAKMSASWPLGLTSCEGVYKSAHFCICPLPANALL